MHKKRYLFQAIEHDLREKMVFIGGPRQVGKTTLARGIAQEAYTASQYLNWDYAPDRKRIMSGQWDTESQLLVFDELHKYKKWKNFIKGVYDKDHEQWNIVVTGSARLDLYRRGGDSLMGRYRYYRLHPFSLAEIANRSNQVRIFSELSFPAIGSSDVKSFETLLKFGGFPEPLLSQDETVLRRFQLERVDRLVREDIRDIELIRDISALQLLVHLLPDKVGSLLSLNSLRQDLEVTHKTVARWVQVLENFYYHYRIYPFASNLIKSLRKEAKMYLWDWSEVADPAKRLENMIASHLLKFAHFLTDTQGYRVQIHFLRDLQQHEVDFIVTIDQKPWFAVEVKTSVTPLSKDMKYFTRKVSIPYVYQVVNARGIDFVDNGIRVMDAVKFLSALV